MTRDELILRTRALVADGERIERTPSMESLRTWLAESDVLLADAWGQMDRYHLVWLSVGRPREAVRDRAMTEEEAAAYVREVAIQKTAALRMSLDAVERQGMPFVGEDEPVRGSRSAEGDVADPDRAGGQIAADRADLTGAIRATGPDLAERIREARERTLASDPSVARRAPNPERMRR